MNLEICMLEMAETARPPLKRSDLGAFWSLWVSEGDRHGDR